ncbi:Crp/Fnr family transcriptional regulator [Xanthocytophaga agilis]|uniref:Crp/Fnr family transcriptional regulator n=1 Tax=Xanthocytophaga agilis TaxID=3048010 RepID=A0AAE3RD43_9BACT|nr:Crp/Fnr family transcriptional regulator [Xanthocytophaga agilis]MDJ1506380.1 Crp/Fnr family transcriptional regulator [Xanthocytophaga agilis]
MLQTPHNLSDIKIDWENHRHLYEEITVPAKTTLLNEGDISRKAYYIKQGCIRLWFNNHGKDITFQFFFENEGVSSFESFRSGQPSLFSMETIEPCTLLMITKSNMEEIFASVPGYKEYVQEHMFQRVAHYSKLFLSRIKDSPKERYLELLRTQPHLIQRVPQHYIASYLGITSVSLSRIRNRI